MGRFTENLRAVPSALCFAAINFRRQPD
jgi:hypothetical protein